MLAPPKTEGAGRSKELCLVTCNETDTLIPAAILLHNKILQNIALATKSVTEKFGARC